ncbi:MAG: formimidoylglutamase [Gammaproteobacteria bacterium]
MWTPADFTLWQGRSDPGEGALRWHQVIREPEAARPGVCLLGFASDLGVRLNRGRVGAAGGPDAMRRAMAGLPARHGVPIYDAGTIVVAEDLAAGQAAYADRTAALLGEGHAVLGLGGGHEIGWATYQGLASHLEGSGGGRIGIVNFDAHFDLRDPREGGTSGTPFRQIADDCGRRGIGFHYLCLGVSEAANTRALFDYADVAGARYLTDLECTPEAAAPMLEALVSETDALYVTVCLDALPAAVAPGVSAPAALGIAPEFVVRCLRHLRAVSAAGAWRVADIAELNPVHDPDGRTARTAARIAWELSRAVG